MRPTNQTNAENKAPGITGYRIWRFFSSLRLALVLMLVLVGLSLIGTFVPQVPASYSQNSGQYDNWLESAARPETGVWYPVLRLLGLFNVFHSVWFLGAGALLVIAIIICTLNRWKGIKTAVKVRAPVTNGEYYLAADANFELEAGLKPAEARNKTASVLKRNRYRLQEEEAEGNIFFNAEKNRFSPLGTYLIHLSLVLFIVGFLVGSYLGFRDPSFMVAEGETREVGNGTGLSLRLQSFTDEYWDNGSPKDYRSQVTLFDNGREVKKGAIQVNHPLSYKGIRFYQSFFGATARLNILNNQGKTVFDGSVLFSQTSSDNRYRRPAGLVQLPQSAYTVYVFGRATNTQDAELAANQVGIELYQGQSSRPVAAAKLTAGEPYKTADLIITYTGNGKFSGFQVSRDPGNSLIWIASSLFLIGLLVVFYFPRRRIQIMLLFKPGSRGPDGPGKVYLRSGAERKTGVTTELSRLENAIKISLKRDSGGK